MEESRKPPGKPESPLVALSCLRGTILLSLANDLLGLLRRSQFNEIGDEKVIRDEGKEDRS